MNIAKKIVFFLVGASFSLHGVQENSLEDACGYLMLSVKGTNDDSWQKPKMACLGVDESKEDNQSLVYHSKMSSDIWSNHLAEVSFDVDDPSIVNKHELIAESSAHAVHPKEERGSIGASAR